MVVSPFLRIIHISQKLCKIKNTLVIRWKICYFFHITYIFVYRFYLVFFTGSSPIIPSIQKNFFLGEVVFIERIGLQKYSFILHKQKKKIIMEETT